MHVAIIRVGIVTDLVELNGAVTIAPDGSHATVEGSIVVHSPGDVVETQPLTTAFEAPSGATLVAAPAEVGIGWSFDLVDGFAPPAVTKAALLDHAAAVRYGVEIAGVSGSAGGQTVQLSTRREDRDGARDTLIAIMAGLRQSPSVFKFVGGPVSATDAEMQTLIAAAFAHVQTAFDVEGSVAHDVALGTITTFAQIDAVFASI